MMHGRKSVAGGRGKIGLIVMGVMAAGFALLVSIRPAPRDLQVVVQEVEVEVKPKQRGAPGEHHMILAGGLTQSGSTLQYNILRMLMESANPEDFVAGYVWNVNPAPVHKYALLKCHDCAGFLRNPKWTSKTVFTIHRDIRDVKVSRQYKNVNSTDPELRKLINFYETVAHQANADWQYEDVMKNGEKFVDEAAAILNQNVPGIHIGEVNATDILKKITDAANDFNAHHKRTEDGKVKGDEFEFFKQHIRDGTWGTFKKTFNKTTCLALSSEFEDYLKKHQYPLQEAC